MSYPPPKWSIRGGTNFRSEGRESTNPRAAFIEWLRLADTLSGQGAQVIVLPPPNVDPALTGLVYAANHGHYFSRSGRFALSSMYVEHRRAEAAHIGRFMQEQLGVTTQQFDSVWEGQADVTTLPNGKFLVSWGVRSDRDSVSQVSDELGAETLHVKLREPYFHGDTCLNVAHSKQGGFLFMQPTAILEPEPDAIREFAGLQVVEVTERDALAYACNALSIGKHFILTGNVSNDFVAALKIREFTAQHLPMPELFGKGGGGPRCLVNELRGFDVEVPSEHTYDAQRDDLHELAKRYPESP